MKIGTWSKEDNPLVNSPHTVETLTQEDWSHAYSRQIALANLSENTNKYFPPVGRIDNVFGDRGASCLAQMLDDNMTYLDVSSKEKLFLL